MSKYPYAPPNADPLPQSERNAPLSVAIPSVVVEHLIHTRPWVKFCSLAGFVAAAFIIFAGILSLRQWMHAPEPGPVILVMGFYLTLTLLFIIPSLWLFKYGNSIRRLQLTREIEDLEQAVADQRAFWRQMAIMIIIILAIFVVTIAFSAIMLLSSL